ncbi:hypothetical protein BIW11_06432, partial [Tropilaelaps mercedesae]
MVSSGKDAHVVIDFGDGSEGITGDLSMEPKYIYWRPGRYEVQVMAKPNNAHDIYTAFAHTTVVVTTSPEDRHIVWSCPTLVEPNVKFQCRLDVLRGTDLSLDFMPGDGTGSKSHSIPDVYPTIVGERVPQFQTPSVILSEEEAPDSAVLPHARVLHQGVVFSFQGYGAVQGKLDMLVKEIYKIIAVVPVQVKSGYFIHKLPKKLAVEAGDIFGFTTTAGRLAFRKVPMEESDLGKRNGLKGQAVRTDDLTMKGQRFLVSALVNTPVNLTFEYQYGDAGAYE